jgi:hypothetical protein
MTRVEPADGGLFQHGKGSDHRVLVSGSCETRQTP